MLLGSKNVGLWPNHMLTQRLTYSRPPSLLATPSTASSAVFLFFNVSQCKFPHSCKYHKYSFCGGLHPVLLCFKRSAQALDIVNKEFFSKA